MLTKVACLATLAVSTFSAATPTTLAQALNHNRHAIALSPEGLTGNGGRIVADAVRRANTVAIGEMRLTREIPQFSRAVCELMKPDLSAVIVESGAVATRYVAGTLGRSDGRRGIAELLTRFPDVVAFLNTEDEYDFVRRCATRARLIGIDQEFIGAAALVLSEILDAKLSPETRQAFMDLQADDRRRTERALKSGNPSELTLPTSTPSDFDRYARLLDGVSSTVRDDFDALRQTHDLVAMGIGGNENWYATRAALMRRNLAALAPTGGRMLVKLGESHLYRHGHRSDGPGIGSDIVERARKAGGSSLHILVLGRSGTRASFVGFARPLIEQSFVLADVIEFAWTTAATQAAFATGWTMFDLRPLRAQSIADLGSDWRGVIEGYDLLVIIPQTHAAKSIRSGLRIKSSRK